jgi:hypothetical protein
MGRVVLLCSSPCLPVPPPCLPVRLMPQLIAVMSKVQHVTQSAQHTAPAYYADRKPNFTVECLACRFCTRNLWVRTPIWRLVILSAVLTAFLRIFRRTRGSTFTCATFSSSPLFTDYTIIRRYTGSLFYLTNIVCHFWPPFHIASELSGKWDTVIR